MPTELNIRATIKFETEDLQDLIVDYVERTYGVKIGRSDISLSVCQNTRGYFDDQDSATMTATIPASKLTVKNG